MRRARPTATPIRSSIDSGCRAEHRALRREAADQAASSADRHGYDIGSGNAAPSGKKGVGLVALNEDGPPRGRRRASRQTASPQGSGPALPSGGRQRKVLATAKMLETLPRRRNRQSSVRTSLCAGIPQLSRNLLGRSGGSSRGSGRSIGRTVRGAIGSA